jgi:tetratricopeptide (TPR) repeat protein
MLAVALAATLGMGAMTAQADDSAVALSNAQALIARAEFTQALATLEGAAKAAPENHQIGQELAILRQVIDLRGKVAAEADPARYEKMAAALRAYYYDKDLYSEALSLDRECHQRLHTAASAEWLAESMLQMGANGDARTALTAYPVDQLSAQGKWMLALAYARTGGRAEVERLLSTLPPAMDANPSLLYLSARVHALLGAGEHARTDLARAFKATPPSALARLKTHAQSCPDFRALAGETTFTQVMATESTVPESGCSRGASCGGCPNAKAAAAQAGGAGASGCGATATTTSATTSATTGASSDAQGGAAGSTGCAHGDASKH